jgi:integrase
MEDIMENEATKSSMQIARRPRAERGSGSIYRPKYRDRKTKEVHECRFFWIKYYRNGTAHRENTHSDKRTVAREMLKTRSGEIATGNWVEPKAQKILMSELFDALLRDYRNNARKSLKFAEQRWAKHLKPVFGEMRAIDVTTDVLDRYVESRKQDGADNATVNREMAILRHGFFLAYRSRPRKVYEVPPFPRLKENAPRAGFVDDVQYKKLCDSCGEPWMRAMLAVGYTFGFRKAELLDMRVRQVDLLNRTITLEVGTTKNGEGRTVKMTNETYTLLCQCLLGKNADDFVFTWANGKPVRDIRTTWANMTKAAELPDLLFHDLRRSAVRNMIRRGVPQVVAQRISGHKTAAVFNRYNIVDDADLESAAARIESRGATSSFAHTVPKEGKTEQTPAN